MKKYWPVLTILLITLAAFYPVFWGRIPLNARNLVAFFSPWYYQRFEGFPAGVPSKPGMLDQIRLYYPYMRLTQESYRSGELPLWNPYNFAGNPHMAEWQSGAFYPLHIFLIFLPLPVYWTLYQMLGFFLAGWFMFLFLRNLKLGRAAAVLAAASFMLSSFMTTWNMEVVTAPHSILWLPLVLLAVDRLVGGTRDKGQGTRGYIIKWWGTGLVGLVLSILSGYWQTTFYVMVVTVIYVIYRGLKIENWKLKIPKSTLAILAWFPLALSLTAFQLLPTWELYQLSSRSEINARTDIQEILQSYLLPFRHLVTFFAPDYFGHPTTRNYFANIGGTYYEHALFFGTIPFLLAILAVVNRRRRGGDTWFWLTMGLGLGSLSFNLPWSRWVYSAGVPVLSTGIANRVLFVPAFAGAVLAAFGLEAVFGNSNKQITKIGFGFLVALVCLAAATRFWGRQDLYLISLRNMVIPAIVLILTLAIPMRLPRSLRSLAMTFTILILAIAQNLYQHHKFTAFSESQLTYPPHSAITWLEQNAGLNRFIGYNGVFLANNFSTYFGLYSVEGYDSLNDYRRSKLLYLTDTGAIDSGLPRSADASLSRNLDNERVLRLMQLMGIRYLVDHPVWLDVGPTTGLARLSEESEQLVFQDGDWRVWEYLDAYPRAFLAGNYEIVNDGQETIDRLYGDDFNPRETLLLSEPLAGGFDISVDGTSSVSVEKYTPTKIIFKTKSNSNQLLFLSDTYYPGWWYRVDNGEKQPVLAADYALRAAKVAAGEHRVTMWYFPESFRRGLVIAGLAGLAGLAAAGLVTSRRFWPNIDR
jgi:hypothetical protein